MNGYRTIPQAQTKSSPRRRGIAEKAIYRILTLLCHPAAKAVALAVLLAIAIGIVGGMEAGTLSFKAGIISVVAVAIGVAVL